MGYCIIFNVRRTETQNCLYNIHRRQIRSRILLQIKLEKTVTHYEMDLAGNGTASTIAVHELKTTTNMTNNSTSSV